MEDKKKRQESNKRQQHIVGASPDWYSCLKDNAKANRKKTTLAEDIIWQRIRNKQLNVKFRRQHPVLDFIADFYSAENGIIIEIDGEYHLEEEQMKLDAYRTERLENMGYRVIRFSNDEVINNIENVIEQIKNNI